MNAREDSEPSISFKPVFIWLVIMFVGLCMAAAGTGGLLGAFAVSTFTAVIILATGFIALGVGLGGAALALFGPNGVLNNEAMAAEIARLESSIKNGTSEDVAKDMDRLISWYSRTGDTVKSAQWSKKLIDYVEREQRQAQ